MYEFKLPDVGEGIHEAEILTWRVGVGDTVSQDQPILDIQTDKAVVEIPAPIGGTIAEIRAKPGTMAVVGDTLVVIQPAGGAGEQGGRGAGEQGGRGANQRMANEDKASPTPAPSQVRGGQVSQGGSTQPPTSTPQPLSPPRRVLAAPAVRKLALELGIDLASIAGSGPAGRILPEDVRRAVETRAADGGGGERQPEPAAGESVALPQYLSPFEAVNGARPAGAAAPAAAGPAGRDLVEEEPLQGLRRRIAERMELAWRVPQVTSFDEVDATNLVALRRQLKPEAERRNVRLTYMPLIIKAAVQALKEFPYFNASLDLEQKKILRRNYYHIGVAMTIPEGLVVPVVRSADRLTVIQLAAELGRLAELGRQRRLGLEELTGSTFTITNFGSFGGQQGTPILNPPEAAILGCGRIEEKAVVVRGEVVVRAMLPLALTFDHRLIDGAMAGQFLARLKALLADPNLLFLEMM